MRDIIRTDLEAQCRQRLDRPDLRITSIEPIPEGHSGFTYYVQVEDGAGSACFVLRLPPPGARIAGPADVVRQGRIMSALRVAGLPVPAVRVLTADPVVDGRPFVLMEAVNAIGIEKARIGQRPLEIARSAIAVLKRLQALPLAQTGIGDEEAVGLQAEITRWAWLMQRAPEELTACAKELGGILTRSRPTEREPTLVHGDYHYGNMLFRGSEVVAVVDWEIAQVGQPLLDLGCLCIASQRRRYEGAPSPVGVIDVEAEELYRLYGTDAKEMRWYLALSLYKYASILGYNLMLHRRGKRPDPMNEGLANVIVGMIDEGIALLDNSA